MVSGANKLRTRNKYSTLEPKHSHAAESPSLVVSAVQMIPGPDTGSYHTGRAGAILHVFKTIEEMVSTRGGATDFTNGWQRLNTMCSPWPQILVCHEITCRAHELSSTVSQSVVELTVYIPNKLQMKLLLI